MGGSGTADRSLREPRKLPETMDCPSCGGLATHLVSSGDRNRGTTEEVFDYYRCSACGLVFMSPIPEDLGPYYRGGYQPLPANLQELKRVAEPERFRMEPILRYKTGGRLLEIGPWIGMFSSNAQDAGFDVTAIEMDGQCVRFLKDTLGITAIQSNDPAGTLASMTESFDVIALWHSLEHLREPWTMLAEAARRLSPGGILLVAIPNIDSYDFSMFRETWTHLDAPRHLHFYSAEALAAQCRGEHLRLLEVTTQDRLSMLLGAETWNKWANRKIPVRYVRGLARAAGLAWSRSVARRNDSGPGITAVFQKPLA